MWHVSSRSGVATLRTAIHLLLTYLLTYLTGTKLYCLATEAHVCEQLAQHCYLKAELPRFEPATF